MRKILIIECLNTYLLVHTNILAYNGVGRHSSGPQVIPYLEIHENDVGDFLSNRIMGKKVFAFPVFLFHFSTFRI